MKQKYVLIFVIGPLVLAYVLDAVVNPLNVRLATPYHFFDPQVMFTYAFTATSVIIKSIALVIGLLWSMSFFKLNKLTKGGILLFLSALMQLYSLQDVATNSRVIPIEWSLALTLTGIVLLIPSVILILAGLAGKAHQSITKDPYYVPDDDTQPKDSKEEDDF